MADHWTWRAKAHPQHHHYTQSIKPYYLLILNSKINELIEEYGQVNAHPVDTPMIAGLWLQRPDKATLTSPDIVKWAEWTPILKAGWQSNVSCCSHTPQYFLHCELPPHFSIMLGSDMVSWSSRKQKMVADSACYAEYIALHEASHEVIFLWQLLDGLHCLPSGATQLLCNNNAASCLLEDHIWYLPHQAHQG